MDFPDVTGFESPTTDYLPYDPAAERAKHAELDFEGQPAAPTIADAVGGALSVATEQAKVAVVSAGHAAKQVAQNIRDGIKPIFGPVSDWFADLVTWLKWIAIGIGALVLLFIGYKIARLFR